MCVILKVQFWLFHHCDLAPSNAEWVWCAEKREIVELLLYCIFGTTRDILSAPWPAIYTQIIQRERFELIISEFWYTHACKILRWIWRLAGVGVLCRGLCSVRHLRNGRSKSGSGRLFLLARQRVRRRRRRRGPHHKTARRSPPVAVLSTLGTAEKNIIIALVHKVVTCSTSNAWRHIQDHL